MQQSPIILDLCLKKTCPGKSNDNIDYIVLIFEKLRFQNVFRTCENARKALFENLRFGR